MAWAQNPLPLVALLLCLALVLWPAPSAVARNRLRRLVPRAASTHPARGRGSLADARGGRAAVPSDPPDGGDRVRRRALVFAGLAGSAVLATFPSPVGGLIAVAVTGGCYVVLGGLSAARALGSRGLGLPSWIRWPNGRSGRARILDRSLPFAIDLLAVCLRAGMPTSSAMRAVAGNLRGFDPAHPGRAAAPSAVPGVCAVLARVAAATELGTEPASAWAEWLTDPAYGPLARALVVTGESGSAVAARLEAVSGQLRVTAGQQAVVRAQRAGIALMAPLGLCFLPAFVCLGVVPVVVGIAGRVFG
ncbi:MAG: type II secretion system F family protein [Actinomycetota bacterium]|nr:type II secretion system F family protein [Actinomycetota bacterium]